MSQKLTTKDQIGFGLMMFAFFLGAGNWIFPPMAGYLSGENMPLAVFGFLMTAVGLPLLSLLAIAKVRGGSDALAWALPPALRTLFGLAIYLILIPMFGMPRTALVAYEMGVQPFVDSSALLLGGFSVLYFIVAIAMAFSRGRLLDVVGQMLTPVLVVLVAVIGWSVFFNPIGDSGVAVDAYATAPVLQSFVDGYQTMDALAAIMFGILFLDILRRKGVTEEASQRTALLRGGFIAAAGLSMVYLILFKLGANAHGIATEPSNGGAIFAQYVAAQFGVAGQVMLAFVIGIACLTTAAGGLSAFGSFIESKWPAVGYRNGVLGAGIVCILVANIGLEMLLGISLPPLFVAYPIGMSLVLMNLWGERNPQPKKSTRIVLAVATIFALLDGAKIAGVDMSSFNWIPGFEYGMAWVIPTTMAALICQFAFKKSEVAQTVNG